MVRAAVAVKAVRARTLAGAGFAWEEGRKRDIPNLVRSDTKYILGVVVLLSLSLVALFSFRRASTTIFNGFSVCSKRLQTRSRRSPIFLRRECHVHTV